jgi:hypothetical protein
MPRRQDPDEDEDVLVDSGSEVVGPAVWGEVEEVGKGVRLTI